MVRIGRYADRGTMKHPIGFDRVQEFRKDGGVEQVALELGDARNIARRPAVKACHGKAVAFEVFRQKIPDKTVDPGDKGSFGGGGHCHNVRFYPCPVKGYEVRRNG